MNIYMMFERWYAALLIHDLSLQDVLFQVLRKSVANPLRMKSEEKFHSSNQFIKVNDTFDILDIRYNDEGQRGSPIEF